MGSTGGCWFFLTNPLLGVQQQTGGDGQSWRRSAADRSLISRRHMVGGPRGSGMTGEKELECPPTVSFPLPYLTLSGHFHPLLV